MALFDSFTEKISQHCTLTLQFDRPAQLAMEPILDTLVSTFRYLNAVGQSRGLQAACYVDRVPPDVVDRAVLTDEASDHLPGALHLGKGIIERDAERVLPETDAEIVLYCGGGFRSALAADNLQRMGYTNVISLDGGVRDWRL